MTTLHYALDVKSQEEALALAALAAERGVAVVEAGSLLVKTAGLAIIGKLREVYPDAVLVADLKTLDMGAQEVGAAAEAGADEVIIAAAASDATVRAAVKAGHRTGLSILATLIGVQDSVDRARQVAALGVDVVLGHNAIDDPVTWLHPDRIESLRQLACDLGTAFGISGSLDLASAEVLLELAPSRMVVGRAITASSDPGGALDAWIALLQPRP